MLSGFSILVIYVVGVYITTYTFMPVFYNQVSDVDPEMFGRGEG